MDEGGSKAKAGQLVRLLNIEVERPHGTWDDLHGFPDGSTMSDAIVRASDTHYGNAGRAFLEQLTRDQRDWEAQYTAFKRAPEFTPAQIARARGQTAKPSRQPHRRGHVSSTDSLEALAAADGDGYFLAGREPARDAPDPFKQQLNEFQNEVTEAGSSQE
jgi:hypothetical protein